MKVKDLFEIGEIMENEEKSDKIKILDSDDCQITGKMLNKNKIILHMKRTSDDSEGNVFVRLKNEYDHDFPSSKKLFASKKIIGMSLNELRETEVEKL